MDSADQERMPGEIFSPLLLIQSELRDEIRIFLSEEELKDAIILVFANKQDLPGALTADEVAVRLELYNVTNHVWYIMPSVASTGEGLWEGIQWLISEIKKKYG